MPEAKDDWKYYRAQMLFYLRLMPLGLVIASVPFLFNLPAWRQGGAVKMGAAISLIYGIAVPLAIWFCYGAFYSARVWMIKRLDRPVRFSWAVHVLVNFIGLWLGLWLAMLTIDRLFNIASSGSKLFSSLLFGSLVMIFFAMHLAYRKAKEEALALRASVAEAKYHALEHQMRPHFLFNALNSLAELIESEQENAAAITYKLSDLYRKILANSATKTTALSAELEVVRAYLEIEQLRFGDRLSYEIEVDESVGEIYLPSLLLQTLVENAVKHGIAPALEGGKLRVEIACASQGLYQASVCNSSQPLQADAVNGNGTGLANSRARLTLLYGERHQFKLETSEQGQTVASFYFTGERID
jgi:sensor histidine kinase YesM